MRLQLQSFSVISHIIYGSAYIRNYLLLFFCIFFFLPVLCLCIQLIMYHATTLLWT